MGGLNDGNRGEKRYDIPENAGLGYATEHTGTQTKKGEGGLGFATQGLEPGERINEEYGQGFAGGPSEDELDEAFWSSGGDSYIGPINKNKGKSTRTRPAGRPMVGRAKGKVK